MNQTILNNLTESDNDLKELINYLKQLDLNAAKYWMRFKNNKSQLKSAWDKLYPGLVPYNVGEILYNLTTEGATPYCKYLNHKTFKQYPKGYFNSCDGTSCLCKHEFLSIKAKEASLKIDKKAALLKSKQTLLERYGVDNAFKMSDHLEKTKKTIKERYGVDRQIDIDGVREKKKQTSLKNYGTEHPLQSKIIRDRIAKTNLEKYGSEHTFHNDLIKSKIKDTMISRYGVENYFQKSEHQEQIRQNRKQELGYENVGQRFLSLETLAILLDKEQFAESVADLNFEQAAKKLNTSGYTIARYAVKYDLIHLMNKGLGSSGQLELCDWLRSLGLTVEYNTRSIIPPLELDIYLPEYKLAIEYNGSYYHCELSGGKNHKYHRNKLLMCQQNNIKLIQICSTLFNDEIKKEVIKDIILSKLNLNKKIMARKCKISSTSYIEARDFLNSNHLQTTNNIGKFRFGLYLDDELVQLLTFGKSRRALGSKNNNSYELIRFATKNGYSVIGGLSRLFKYFTKTYIDISQIISYSDLRYFTGDSLLNLNFQKISMGSPGYWYTANYKSFHHRYSFRKTNLIQSEYYDASKTEWEIMQDMGYDRLWDCGHAKFIWERKVK